MTVNAYVWNEQYPEGTPVKVCRDNGEILETVTLSEAWVDENGIQVIMVKGIAGCYRLDRVTPNVNRGLCAECGSPEWCHSVIGHDFVEPKSQVT